jgi:hypothetical protein
VKVLDVLKRRPIITTPTKLRPYRDGTSAFPRRLTVRS